MCLTPRLVRGAIIGAAVLASVCLADPVTDRLQQLETRVNALEQENATLKKQLTTRADNGTVAVPQGREAKLAVGGFIQIHGEAGDAPDARFPSADRFLVRRARLGLKGTYAESFDFVLQTDLGNNSTNSTAGFRAQLTDAFILWNKYSLANLTVGQFKVPYGYEQLLADTKILTIERSLPNDQLTLPRQVGAMLSGSVLSKRLTYAFAIGNGNGNNNSFNDNEQFDYIGRLAGTVFEHGVAKLTVGANAFTSYDTNSFVGHRTGRGADAELIIGPAEFDAELLSTHCDRDIGADYDAEGWALTAAYMLVPNKWRVVARFESYDPNTSLGGDATKERTLGFDYFIKGDDLKASLNYLFGNPPGSSRHQDRLIGRMQIVF